MTIRIPAKDRVRRGAALDGDPLWYKDAVVYQLHVKSYFDGNDDGIGDFAGLIGKLDYIAGLGVNTVWLLPFFPSPRRDDGYDVADYRGVHPDYGSMRDAQRFIDEAHRRGLRVIIELVINHTSDQHPWFQRARHAPPGSNDRDFYVWSDDDRRYAGTRIIFVDTEPSNWTWDPVAKAYYWHRFYSHQPDLNFDNPRVVRAVLDAMRHWLRLGVDGLRLDAVPYLVEREGTNNENLPQTHAILKRLRAEVDAAFPGRMLLAEANQWPEDVQQYFGSVAENTSDAQGEVLGDECHMAFHFPLMPRMYMAIAQEDRFPIVDILRQTPDIPSNCQWAIFLRNHDELTLEMVTDRERDYLWKTYAADPRARLNIGIRRRLAPLVERDRRRIELLNSLLLSMPGTPVIYYGDEIGMGDNIYLGDRDGVRTPMQWSPDRNGGFSRADPARLVLPPIMDPLYGYQALNVETQNADPHSLLNWMRRMLTIRKRCKAFGRGSIRLLAPANRRILAYLRQHDTGDAAESQLILCVANLSGSAQAVELNLAQYAGRVPVEMLGSSAFPPIGQLPYLLTMAPHGFHWFLLAEASRMPEWYVAPPEPLPEYITLVLRGGIEELFDTPTRTRLEREVLPQYLARRRWYAARQAPEEVRIVRVTPLPRTQRPMLLLELMVGGARYLLPVGLLPEEAVITPLPQQLALARVRRAHSVSLLTDAMTIDAFARSLLAYMREAASPPPGEGGLQFRATPLARGLSVADDAEVRRLTPDQPQSSLVIGETVVIKLFRHLHEGIHPEAEMMRMLTARGFANIAPLYGEMLRVESDGRRYELAVAQAYLHNQGDAWAWMQAQLQRGLRDAVLRLSTGTELDMSKTPMQLTMGRVATAIGRRLGEMHQVLAQAGEDPAFAPRTADAADAQALATRVSQQLDRVWTRLDEHCGEWPEGGDETATWRALRPLRGALEASVAHLAQALPGSLLMRIHGDLHLRQVLVAQDDAYFVDFEGEPTRGLAQRRALASPLQDVAGILRSLEDAVELAAATPLEPGDEAVAGMREPLLRHFLEAAASHFLEAYARACAGLPHRWRSSGDEQALLRLLLIERAAEEVEYEARHGSAGMWAPLRALLHLARATQARSA